MNIFAISDTHEHHEFLTPFIYEAQNKPHVIIHAGDVSNSKVPVKNLGPMRKFLDWYSALPIEHKIFVPGNHDTSLYNKLIDIEKEYPTITYLVDDFTVIDGVKFYGSPWTPAFGSDWAWNMKRGYMDRVWSLIPSDTDVLITHGPPKGVQDLTNYTTDGRKGSEQVGCKMLMNALDELNVKAHIFGHIHDESGIYNHGIKVVNEHLPMFINASCVTLHHIPKNGPVQFAI